MKAPSKVKLIIEVSDADLKDHPEACELCGDGFDPERHKAMKMDILLETDSGLTLDDLMPKTPQKFVDQGMPMAVVEALLRGLQSARGTSFEYASQDAAEKMCEALDIVGKESVMRLVREATLAAAKPEGEC